MVVQSGSGPQQLEDCSKILGDQVDIVLIFHYGLERKKMCSRKHIELLNVSLVQAGRSAAESAMPWLVKPFAPRDEDFREKDNHTGLDYVGFQPEQGFVFDQENQSENYGSAQSSFIWRHWDRLGNYKNTRRYGAACKFCMHRVEDGRIPRLEQHTLECTRVPGDTKTELRVQVEIQSRTASVTDVAGYWMFVATDLQQQLQSCLQPKGEFKRHG